MNDDDDIPAGTYRRVDLLLLAGRCEAAAAELAAEGDHAAEAARVLAQQGHSDADAQKWTDRKYAAAAAARQYAQGLRAEANTLGPDGRPSQERIDQAEKVASAAELGGILIDGRPAAERAATADNADVWYPTEKAAWEAGTHPAQTKAAAVEASGAFEHIAEEGQVPFWRLRDPADQAANEQASPTQVDDDADEA